MESTNISALAWCAVRYWGVRSSLGLQDSKALDVSSNLGIANYEVLGVPGNLGKSHSAVLWTLRYWYWRHILGILAAYVILTLLSNSISSLCKYYL